MRAATLPAIIVWVSLASTAQAQGAERPVAGERGRYAEELQNPVTDLMNIAFINHVDAGLGENDERNVLLTIQPLLPLRVFEHWHVIVWSVLSVWSQAPRQDGGERINGMGDTVLRLLLTPAARSTWQWGLGPAFLVPTATREALGADAFGIGGSGAFSYRSRPWTLGLLLQHLASVEEARGRESVHRSLIRPNLSFTTYSGVSIGLNSRSMVDWERPPGERWLVPVELTLGQVADVGGQTLNFEIGARKFVAAPTGGPDWGVQLTVVFLFPVRPKEPPPQP